jgi:hypothetical protein
MGRSKAKESKVSSTRHMQNFEMASRPVKVETGFDECVGQVHSARFLRGYVSDPQDLWLQARTVMETGGLAPITNYELVSLGVGDLLTPGVWEEVHNPGSRLLTIQMLSPKSVEAALRFPDKLEAPKPFDNLNELKLAVATLDTAIQRVMPWNYSFRTLSLFLMSNDFGASELGGKSGRVTVLTGFVNEVLLGNARSWVEKKKYFSHQDLTSKWPSFLGRNSGLVKGEEGHKKKAKSTKPSPGGGGHKPRIPRWVCMKFNQGVCKETGDRHESPGDPNYILKHVCSKLGPDGRCCMQAHAEKDHK